MDVAGLIDPEIAEALAALPAFVALDDEVLPKVRRQRDTLSATLAAQCSDAVVRTEHVVPGAPGDPDVVLRVHRPAGGGGQGPDGPLPCLYWMHGGGYVIGTALGDDPRLDRWCPMFGCVGVSVEYRLAPETAYPGPLDDAYAGLRWVADHADELGIDPTRLGIGGASAGAGLAAGLALLARDRAEVPLAFQLLIYPMLDDRIAGTSTTWEVPVWAPTSNRYGWGAYLGDLFGGEPPAYAAAARATDLSGLPPAFISVGTLDGFLDEDVDYALRLNHAGVPTELHVYPGAPHGFDLFAPGTALARRATAELETWLAAALAGDRAKVATPTS